MAAGRKKPPRSAAIDPEQARLLKAALAKTPAGGKGKDPGPLRQHVAAVFDQLTADRAREVPWDRLAIAFSALGIRMPDGEAPTGKDLANTYHAERYARGGAREPRKGGRKDMIPGEAPAAEAPPPPASAPPPSAADDGTDLAKLRAALDPNKGRAPLKQSGFDMPTDPNWRNQKG